MNIFKLFKKVSPYFDWEPKTVNSWKNESEALSVFYYHDDFILSYPNKRFKTKIINQFVRSDITNEESSAIDYLFYNHGWTLNQIF